MHLCLVKKLRTFGHPKLHFPYMGFSHISYNLEYPQLLVSKKLSELLGVKIGLDANFALFRAGAPRCEGSFVENLSGNLDFSTWKA